MGFLKNNWGFLLMALITVLMVMFSFSNCGYYGYKSYGYVPSGYYGRILYVGDYYYTSYYTRYGRYGYHYRGGGPGRGK